MKKCIWCSKTELITPFNNLAHTIPKTLGGQFICENVCDNCNRFFGTYYKGQPPVETVIKETFNISRARFLSDDKEIGKNKPLSKFSSIYFKVDFKKNTIDLKQGYKFHIGFQENIGRQIKKGIYKIYLEEIERQRKIGHNEQYNFIREFARYDLGDFPVFYFERSMAVILLSKKWARHPEFFLEEDSQMKYLVREAGFFEFEFLGHVFGIATSRMWKLCFKNYIQRSMQAKQKFFKGWRLVKNFNDIDLTLSILDDKS